MTIRFADHPGWGPLHRDLVTDPANYRKLRNGCLWLLLYVIASANHRTGKLQTSWGTVAEETGLSEPHLRSMAGHLRTKGYLNVHVQSEDQVLFVVHGWKPVLGQMRTSTAVKRACPAGGNIPNQPATPPLATEVASALGAQEQIEDIVDLVNTNPETVLREKLEATLAVPAYKIRVSRFALFRYLLAQTDNDEDTAH